MKDANDDWGLPPREFVEFCFRWRWLILALAIAGMLGAAVSYRVMPPVYTAQIDVKADPAGTPIDTVETLLFQVASIIDAAHSAATVQIDKPRGEVHVVLKEPSIEESQAKLASIKQTIRNYNDTLNKRISDQYEMVKKDVAAAPESAEAYKSLMIFRAFISGRDSGTSNLFFTTQRIDEFGLTPPLAMLLGTTSGVLLAIFIAMFGELWVAWRERATAPNAESKPRPKARR